MSRPLLSLILFTVPIAQALGVADAETEIRSLIQAVRGSACEFDPNGTLHPATRAAEHLELKYAQGEGYTESAEAIAERLATGSSWTGEPHLMICDGAKISSAEWLAE